MHGWPVSSHLRDPIYRRPNGHQQHHHQVRPQAHHARQGRFQGPAQGQGKPSKAKPSKRPQYDERTVAIATAARKMATPKTLQGPVPKQVADIMRDLKNPREALASVGLSQKEVKALANGDGDKDSKAKLRKLAERVNGAPQWTRGRALASTLTAWLEVK
jgi:hypothetical protein